MLKFPFKIMKRSTYEKLMDNYVPKYKIPKPVVETIEWQKYTTTGVWTARDPMPFDNALDLMIRNFRKECKDKIDIKVEVETWADGVTRTVRLTTLLPKEKG